MKDLILNNEKFNKETVICSSRALRILTALVLGMIFTMQSVIAQEDCGLSSSMNNFMSSNSTGGVYGYYLKRVGGSMITQQNENYPFYPASSMKVFLHTYAVRNHGLGELTYAYTGSETCDDDHTGSTPVIRSLGNALPIMMVNSGNATTNAIMELIGDGSASLGRTRTNNMLYNSFDLSGNTKINHKLACDNVKNNPYNIATAKDFGKFYEGVMTNNYLNNTQRTTFVSLMLNETNGGLANAIRNEVDNVIAANNLTNLSGAQIQDFKSRIELAYKAGNIGTSYLSSAGWVSLPFKEYINNNVYDREFSFCIFYDNITNFTTSINATVVELLSNQILAALQTWNAQAKFVASKASYTTEQIGELITPEIGVTKDALDVAMTRSTQAVTAVRNTSGKLRVISWSVAEDGSSISKQKGYNTVTNITAVKTVKLRNGRFITASRLTNGNLQIISWYVDALGNFTISDYKYAGNVGDIDLVRMSDNRIATVVSTAERDMKVIIWNIDGAGDITRMGDNTIPNADIVAGASVLSSLKLATATQNRLTGNLEVQSWGVSYTGGTVTLKSTASAGSIADVSMENITANQFVTNVIQGNGLQKSIVWEICFNGSLQRKGDASYTYIRDIASSQVSIGSRQVVAAQDNNNKFSLSVFETMSEGEILKSANYVSETIGQVEVTTVNPVNQVLLTAYTTSTDNLKLRTWSINDMLIAELASIEVKTEDDGSTSSEVIETEEEMLDQQTAMHELDERSAAVETALEQNYPNPFTHGTAISYSLKEAGQVEIKILDFKGNEVQTVINDEQQAGKHTALISGEGLAQGMYFIQMKAGGQTYLQKIIRK